MSFRGPLRSPLRGESGVKGKIEEVTGQEACPTPCICGAINRCEYGFCKRCLERLPEPVRFALWAETPGAFEWAVEILCR